MFSNRRKHARNTLPRVKRRLQVEQLEDRCVLSTLALSPLVQVSGDSPFAGSTADDVAGQPGINTLHSEVEPYVAVNPTNPHNAVAAWIQDSWSNGGGRGNVAAVTFDAGATW
jgi:hypothetical protein